MESGSDEGLEVNTWYYPPGLSDLPMSGKVHEVLVLTLNIYIWPES